MADCSSIESLLDELLNRLDNNQSLEGIIQQLEALTNKVADLERIDSLRGLRIQRIEQDLAKLSNLKDVSKRLSALENGLRVARTAIFNTTNILNTANKNIRNLQRDVIGFKKKFLEIDKKIKLIDKKNTDQDKEINLLKAAVLLLTGAGGALAVLLARILALALKQEATDKLLDSIRRNGGGRGAKGDKGDRGFTGQKGDRGDKGDRGEGGDKGDRGDKGNTGDRGSQGNTGAKGDRGDQGPKGDRGLKGDDGDQGQKGDAGRTGIKGDRGATGLKGEKGDEGMVKIVKVPEIVKQTQIVRVPQIVDKIKEVIKTVVVYRNPDLSQLLAKIAELRSRLIFGSSVEIPESCSESSIVPTTDLPTFLNALEDKLSAIEELICEKEEIEAYNLGTFSETTTVNLQAETRFIKITVTSFPDGITRRFGRTTNQPDNYRFGNVAFESSLGLSPEIDWEWIESYFYPDKENDPNKIHIYTANLNTTYTITGYKVKL